MYHLPNSVIDEIRFKIAEDESSLSKELKLELLKKEEEQIKEEEKHVGITEEQIKTKDLQDWISKEQDIAQSSVLFSASQLKAFTEVVTDLAKKSSIDTEKRQLQELKSLLELRKQELLESEEEGKIEKESTLKEESPVEDEKEQKRKKETKEQKQKVIHMGDKLEKFVDSLQNRAEEMETKDIPFLLGLDKNRDGYVDLDELQEATKEYSAHLPSELVEYVLKKLDGDNDNKIPIGELRDLANKHENDFVGIIDTAKNDQNKL